MSDPKIRGSALKSEVLLVYAKYLANTALILVLLVIFMGGWTRINDAGLSCPDWPGCFGIYTVPSTSQELQQAFELYPQIAVEQGKSWLEMIHRYLAAALGVLIILLVILAVRLQKDIQQYPWGLSVVLLLLVVFQGLLGMWTVTMKLLPIVVTAHLSGGLLICILLFMLRARLANVSCEVDDSFSAAKSSASIYLFIAVLLVALQILLGGWTSSNYAGWGCSSWLGCNPETDIVYDYKLAFSVTTDTQYSHQGGNLPLEARGAIQIVHRIAALLVLAYLIFLYCWWGRGSSWQRKAQAAVGLTIFQISLGVATVIFAMPSILAMAHHVIAVTLLLTVISMLADELNTTRFRGVKQ